MNDDIWEFLCAGLPLLAVLFALNVVLLILLAFVFPFSEPGTAPYYVNIFSFIVISASLVSVAAVIRKCRARG